MAIKELTEGTYCWCPTEKIPSDICDKLIKSADGYFKNHKLIGKQDDKARKGKTFFDNQQWVYDLVWKHMEDSNMLAGWDFEISSAENYQIGKYTKGDFYGVHQDSIGTHATKRLDESNPILHNKTRKISMSLILNNDFEGGRVRISLQHNHHIDMKEQEKGNMIFFPSFQFHEVTPVTQGTRYSLVMWFLGSPWR
tara:strand:+ start:349 stop:936 length:588 start_codon:yes stop_codon:yes gene_type:complete